MIPIRKSGGERIPLSARLSRLPLARSQNGNPKLEFPLRVCLLQINDIVIVIPSQHLIQFFNAEVFSTEAQFSGPLPLHAMNPGLSRAIRSRVAFFYQDKGDQI